MNTTKTSKTSVEDLNEQLMQDEAERQKAMQEMYWDIIMTNPATDQWSNEAQTEKPTLLEIMEKFKGKNLFPEATERVKTYLERIKESESIILNEMQSNRYCHVHHLKVDEDGMCSICREESNK
jgi:hypothetical protein